MSEIEFVMHDGLDDCCLDTLKDGLPGRPLTLDKLACNECGGKLKLVEGVWYYREVAP